MSKIWMIVIVVILVGAGGFFLMEKNKAMTPVPEEVMTTVNKTETPVKKTMMEETVMLLEQNKSGESGTAVLTEKDGKVMVTLEMTGALADVPQPAHIHVGSCPDVGAVSYPLTNLVDGKSETVLNVTLAELAAKQPLGINVHKSVAESKVYVSCGDLALPMASGAAKTMPASSPTASSASSPTTGGQVNIKY